jgi:hypothetical protein
MSRLQLTAVKQTVITSYMGGYRATTSQFMLVLLLIISKHDVVAYKIDQTQSQVQRREDPSPESW